MLDIGRDGIMQSSTGAMVRGRRTARRRPLPKHLSTTALPIGGRYVVALHELDHGSTGIAGSKASTLGHLLQAGFSVPDGFVLTVAAFDRFLAANEIGAG